MTSTSNAAIQFDVPLIWHVESEDGKPISSEKPDQQVNPASVVKLATTFRALETLGPDRRFVTTFGVVDGAGGAPAALVVQGGADPDFHFENAVIVAHALAGAGVTDVRGDLVVGATFWLGWERGTAGREPDPIKRRLEMGRRLVAAWSPAGWSPDDRRNWEALAAEKRWDPSKPPSIRIGGEVRTEMPPKWRPVVEHRSEPLLVALRRFNVFSNNDIERLDASIGPAAEMPAFLASRWGDDARKTSFATSSGLNANRMTPRLVVRLLRDLRRSLAARGHQVSDVMPVIGCGESTLRELFPRLRESHEADGLVGKTGTLNLQDGGVSALAGYLPAGPGYLFFVAAPGAGQQLPKARSTQEEWIRRVLLKAGKPGPLACPPPVPSSYRFSEVATVAKAAAG